MRRLTALALTAATLVVTAVVPERAHAQASTQEGAVPQTSKKKVEIVFAIDTTGSMGGLIEGAKRKIWTIANEAARAKQRPEVRVGLVAYRDRGDSYVTQVTPLTTDLDKIYGVLMGLNADGGGDTPEDVNAGLRDAVEKQPWTDDRDTLKMVFLVGDAPPHMDYQDEPKWAATAQKAIRKNIAINTLLCGGDNDARTTWLSIAHASEGRFAAIPQDGGTRIAVSTPYDADLARLAGELDSTTLTYGRREARVEKSASRAAAGGYAAAAAPSVAADRAVFKATASSAMSESDDLVSLADKKGAGAVANVEESALPDALVGKSKAERTRIVGDLAKKRDDVQKQIAVASKKREAYLSEHAAKGPGAAKDGFDAEVVETLHAQAARVGLSY